MLHFISDLHLSPQAPGVTRRFLDFIGGKARDAAQLYILGDLFEVWPGDDSIDDPDDTYNQAIVDALRSLTDTGVKVSVMHGNRDFLLGEEFAARSGASLLPDPYVLSLPAWQFVLSHGDSLCTDDTDYQAFRTRVRAPVWRASFLQQPLAERKALATVLRQQSEMAKLEKLTRANYPLDLNPGATDDFLRQHGYATFIHGHTHRPATHDHLVDGIHVERWVMSDWHEDQGEYLCWDGVQLTRHVLR
ncbi:UDP-2,3-diacylglucosamine diphosphatase [Propionivibrio sp.]|uniref:UDP-2,3-diacylglucosamine diphosphatase n=1 Tax=Propionivibrio sp. TaxID=2212460 RepID=UPI0025D66117|nr:UDP-2,3-diacylglucosamine diphosphatase [Propionivibrio sp.]MBK7356224.1 UDP-2,3-diacylglucosamine diphosphatase [Propionivibrio sp.]MBK8746233.1 UDP-2,3-diacylglucosamine diphosphatase [Propionivibrio sp.]MBL0208393.1 UDP-2,3-diacylglucosamine diphosphatase [Propionivibrio sp.]